MALSCPIRASAANKEQLKHSKFRPEVTSNAIAIAIPAVLFNDGLSTAVFICRHSRALNHMMLLKH